MIKGRHLAIVGIGTVALLLATASPAAASFNPIGTEPTGPYAQPTDVNVPKRGCTTTVSSPTSPPPGGMAVQFIYAWHDGNGNNYTTYAAQMAKIADRMDWLVDNSSNYDQHINFSCRTGFDTSTYAGYAQALIVPEKIEAGNLSGETGIGTVEADLAAAGYNDPNRYYVVFEDFDGTATASAVGCSPGANCIATSDDWDSGTLAHELFHALGADHTYTDETGATSVTDVMISQYNDWQLDQNFNGYYDPSETSATFHIYFYPDTRKVNIASNPVFTTAVCCDVGYSNDLLTAQERTIEADAPWGSPTGFALSGGGWFQVTPPGPSNAVSARYYDGRRSLTMNVQSHADGYVSVNRRIPITAGTRHQFYVRLATSTSGNLQLQLSWYNASNVLLSNSTGSSFALSNNWREYAHSAVAPVGATQVMVRVVSPVGQNFSYVMDGLQLMACNNGATTDGCRFVEP